MSALALGSLVESVRNPIMDAYVPKNPVPKDAVLCVPAKSFEGVLSNGEANNFKLALTKLFHISHSSEEESAATLKSIRVNRYVLKSPKELFRTLCLGDESARQWLNDGIKANSKSYLVVELQTAQDATITRSDTTKRSNEVGITVPTSTIATGGADVLSMGAMLDVSADMGRITSNESSKKFITEGESIFAVGYKKVLWKSWGFKRKEIEKAVLDKEITWSMLGQKRSRDGEEEMVSVDLGDDLDSKLAAEGDSQDEEDEEDEDEEDDISELLKTGVDIGGQTFLVPSAMTEDM
jgi:hypothetical protein